MPETYRTITPAGQEHIDASPALQAVIERFWDSPEPEAVLGGLFIGSERFSKVCRIGGLAIKVSSPTSSQDTYDTGEPITPENLIDQFNYLTALREHLAKQDTSITVPEQFFVLRSRYNGYLAGMTHMADWLPYREWAPQWLPGSETAEHAAAAEFSDSIKQRIRAAVQGTPLWDGLNDLKLHKPQIHGGNILLPAEHKPAPDTPLCIIDQPGQKRSKKPQRQP